MKQYLDMCRYILENGQDRDDRTGTGTRSVFGYQTRYDLTDGFPLMTTKKMFLRPIAEELLWFIKGDTNIKYLVDRNVKIWNEWPYEIFKKSADYHGETLEEFISKIKELPEDDPFVLKYGELGPVYGRQWRNFNNQGVDQVAKLVDSLKNNPFSRRILTNLYVHSDLSEMNLYPCAYSMTFNVTQKKGEDKLTLNGILNQRSQDILAANNWNVVQYAVLLHMLARTCDMNVGELVHVIADAHIYDRHIPIIKELIERPQYDAPKFILNPDKHDFYEFTKDDVSVENYITGEQITDIPIAI